MNIHEYQSKKLLNAFGIDTAAGDIAETPDEAVAVAENLKGPTWVVKAQIHSGGRGKAGGVVLCKNLQEVRNSAKFLLGSQLVTHQTGPKGKLVRKVYIENAAEFTKQLYLSLTLNRIDNQVCIIACAEGGTDIEEIAENSPSKITKLNVSPVSGIREYHVRRIAEVFEIPEKFEKLHFLLNELYEIYVKCDCCLIEINPLVITNDGELLALDVKISFDDNALYRHPSIALLEDPFEEAPEENQAKANNLSYVKLDGNIGCLVNGAGLAMATMDIIKQCGGIPANFLDVGGSADKECVSNAFQIILNDKGVKAILVNIFGGIMHCDIIAQGIIDAAKEMQVTVPLVVRLQGTNNELGKKMLSESGINVITADDLDEAAQKTVAALKD